MELVSEVSGSRHPEEFGKDSDLVNEN